MMGPRQVAQGALFYEFSLEAHVPTGHLLNRIDRFVDLFGLRRGLRPFYSALGRPSIDPELMIRMLLVGSAAGQTAQSVHNVSAGGFSFSGAASPTWPRSGRDEL